MGFKVPLLESIALLSGAFTTVIGSSLLLAEIGGQALRRIVVLEGFTTGNNFLPLIGEVD